MEKFISLARRRCRCAESYWEYFSSWGKKQVRGLESSEEEKLRENKRREVVRRVILVLKTAPGTTQKLFPEMNATRTKELQMRRNNESSSTKDRLYLEVRKVTNLQNKLHQKDRLIKQTMNLTHQTMNVQADDFNEKTRKRRRQSPASYKVSAAIIIFRVSD
ncbi:hypothetical protein EVAR_5794_1 [Eumeta japonica]|uniref:Uncharacterized protein n=1 Tax=Eumeta variegata TaxID=151549 RepID=A0A4C1T4D5_EUMVA|nr:hypothetical protein EVAR_5794_1 [Eumeta japonica]